MKTGMPSYRAHRRPPPAPNNSEPVENRLNHNSATCGGARFGRCEALILFDKTQTQCVPAGAHRVAAERNERYANPTMLPSASMSMLSDAGFFGRPGIVMISPDSTTMNPAPAFK